jgi:urease subunit alpha
LVCDCGVKTILKLTHDILSFCSIPTPQPVSMRPMFGAKGKAVGNTSVVFVSQAAAKAGIGERLGLSKAVEPVIGCRNITKKDMVHNSSTPTITVDPETFEVVADGRVLKCDPVDTIPLSQKYFLF